jgi:hypothetical protein
MPAFSGTQVVGLVVAAAAVLAVAATWCLWNSSPQHLAFLSISGDGESVVVVRHSGLDQDDWDSSVVSHVYVRRAMSGELVAEIAVPGFRTIYVEQSRGILLDGLVLAGVIANTEVGAVAEISLGGAAVSRQCEVPGVSVGQRRSRGGAILSVSTADVVDVLGANGVSCTYSWDGCVELGCDKGGGAKMWATVPPVHRERARENTQRVLDSMIDGMVGVTASTTVASLYDECYVAVSSGTTVVERRVGGAGVGTPLRAFLGPSDSDFDVASTGVCGGPVVAANDRRTWLYSDEGWIRLE